jgi:hypothetical protein
MEVRHLQLQGLSTTGATTDGTVCGEPSPELALAQPAARRSELSSGAARARRSEQQQEPAPVQFTINTNATKATSTQLEPVMLRFLKGFLGSFC